MAGPPVVEGSAEMVAEASRDPARLTGAGEATSSLPRRSAGIDALRGVAIGLVMLRHALPAVAPGAGVVGVVMFFALSGYLITGVLTGEQSRTGRINLRRFYKRRARRLVPAMLAMLAGLSIVTLAVDPLHDRGELGRTLLFALTWTGDLPFGHASDATFHLWTLATEEQFYLLWPALLLLTARRAVAADRSERGRTVLTHRPGGGSLRPAGAGGGRGSLEPSRDRPTPPPGPVAALRPATTALRIAAAASVLACLATVAWLRAAPDAAYSLPTAWAGCFVIGGAVRVHGGDRRVPGWAAAAAIAALGVLSVIPLRGHSLTYLAGGPAIAALTGVLLVAWRTWTPTGAARALVALGTVSYAAYLWNYPLTLWLRPLGLGGGLLAAALTLVAAALSWRYVESRPPRPTGP